MKLVEIPSLYDRNLLVYMCVCVCVCVRDDCYITLSLPAGRLFFFSLQILLCL
jgi:hypothetical protein